ncbi:MAG: hypothetical protein QM516_14055 [Limnohabitans sp.]|nr:hypothetical protein [Limnohabitans sp.]
MTHFHAGQPHATQAIHQGSAAAARLLEIARVRLEAARAMRALSAKEAAILAMVDAAARGEVAQVEADDALALHLESREVCLDAMQCFNDEWTALAATVSRATFPSELEAIASEIVVMLDDIARTDAAFATELTARRQAARFELSRTDGARSAGRAYFSQALGVSEGPRFTDRKG